VLTVKLSKCNCYAAYYLPPWASHSRCINLSLSKNKKHLGAVDLENFLREKFYDGGDNHSARWDEEWMAIRHPENGVLCDQSGD